MKPRKTVFVNGCFDLLHPGHVHFLQEAASHGDILVVGLNADDTVKQAKGKLFRSFDERKAILDSLRFVSVVLPFRDSTAEHLVEILRPDVYCTGEEYRSKSPEARTVAANGGKVIYIGRLGDYSTTKEGKK